MKDLLVHSLMFFGAGSIIVAIGVMFGEPDDERALKVLPGRLVRFFAGCLAVLGVMLLFEHTFASIH